MDADGPLTSGPDADGEIVWSWRPKGWRSSCRRCKSASEAATVAIGKVHRGERALSRKPLRREGRSVPPVPVVSRPLRNFSGARAPGAAVTRPSLRPLLLERAMNLQSSGEFRRENADAHPAGCLIFESGSFPRRRGESRPITTGLRCGAQPLTASLRGAKRRSDPGPRTRLWIAASLRSSQ